MTEVRDRIVLITGAASGIGRLLADRMADRGAELVLWDLSDERLEHAVAELRPRVKVHGYSCDVSDPAAVRAAAERVRSEVGDPEVVVNNAGIVSGARLLDLTEEKIAATFGVNTLSLYWVTRAFLPAMVARNRGHVVTIASAAGLVGVAKQTDYAASKHAAVGFDESLRVELRQYARGVRTTVVCPYYIDTGMFDGVRTRVPLLLPILKQDRVAARIARAVDRNQRVLIMPPLIRLLPVLRVLPAPAFDTVMDLFGVNVSMQEFVGRAQAGTARAEAPTAAPVEALRTMGGEGPGRDL